MSRPSAPLALVLLAACAGDAGAPTWITGDCQADRTTAIQRVVTAAQPFRTPCASATDCMSLEARLTCQPGALVAIARTQHDAWLGEQARLERQICPYLSGDCSLAVDQALGRLACVDGRCTLVPEAADGGP